MGVFEMVVLIVFISTVGKVVHSAVATRGAGLPGGEDRIRALEQELRANEARLSQAEERVAELSEKVVFVERLLEKPAPAGRLPGEGA